MEKYREIEKSIIKKYRKKIWSPFVRCIKEFNLINENDKIAVCISGGKDSMLLAKCLEELQRHGIFKFNLEYIVLNPGYNKKNLEKVKDNAKTLNIPIKIFDINIFGSIKEYKETDACYRCAKMRRGHLYNIAQELGCNKIALGHHFNDVIETIMLNMLYTGNYGSMLPKLKSQNFKGLELIRPLLYVKEEDIKSFVTTNELSFIDCACFMTKKKLGKRLYIKNLIKTLQKENKGVDVSIFNSMFNVNVDKVITYKKDKEKINYYDEY